MANGCAVIAKNAPGFKDVIINRKNGLLFNNEKELEEKLLLLLRDLKLRSKLIDEGYITVEKFRPEKIVNEFFGAITQTLANNERVEIRGFGSFSVNGYKPYVGRNPKTGVKINVPSKKLPFFKVGKELKHRVDQV